MIGAARNVFSHRQFPVSRLLAEKRKSISVCLPARDEAATIGTILQQLMPLARAGLVDQIAVVDDSTDGTAELARSLGAEVYSQSRLLPERGAVLGKGDAMWRALSVLRGELVCFLDADSEGVGPHYVCGLLGPLICERQISFVKGYYRRPFRVGQLMLPDGGGRVTELTARPMLQLFFAELAAVRQPLAGEIAAPRGLLERLPFVTGYGVDVALLIDAYREVGMDGIAQVDLELRQNAHRPLSELGPMAVAVAAAITSRLEREGRVRGVGDCTAAAERVIERPPIADLRAAA